MMLETNSILKKVLAEIEKKEDKSTSYLISEQISLILFYFMYFKYTENENFQENAMIRLNNVINETVTNPETNTPHFFNGVSGIGWLLVFLSEENLIELEIDTFISDSFDTYLYDEHLLMSYRGNFTFIKGSLGSAYYFISRYNTTKSNENKTRYKNYIVEQIFFLENQKNSGLESISKESNVSIINFLVRAKLLGEFDPIINSLLKVYASNLYSLIKDSKYLDTELIICIINLSNLKSFENSSLRKLSDRIIDNNLIKPMRNDTSKIFEISFLYDQLYKSKKDNKLKYFSDLWLKKAHYNFDCNVDNEFGLESGLPIIGLYLMSLSGKLKTNWFQYSLIISN